VAAEEAAAAGERRLWLCKMGVSAAAVVVVVVVAVRPAQLELMRV